MLKKKLYILIFYFFCFQLNAFVVTSIRPLSFIASAITDGITDVYSLVPIGSSPHDYSIKISDLKKIKNSDLLIWIGPNLENFLIKVIHNVPKNNVITLMYDVNIKKMLLKNNSNDFENFYKKRRYQKIDDHLNFHNVNTHIWLSSDIAFIIAKNIYEKLIILYPEYQNKLNHNLNVFKKNLKDVNKKINDEFFSLRNKKYFVFHDAYAYFEQKYNLSSSGYFTINPTIYPGIKTLYKIKKILNKENISCIFVEPQFKFSIIESIVKNTNVKIGILDPLGDEISINKNSYLEFLTMLSQQFKYCLYKNI
ncbi:MAG: zinc ABC transporter substrate-binding protein ZnuA [Arsenophonus sp.]|nr:MAG: zinc ABC transporter substrate-binding protein ZnuA [Arsenophonus sp.]